LELRFLFQRAGYLLKEFTHFETTESATDRENQTGRNHQKPRQIVELREGVLEGVTALTSGHVVLEAVATPFWSQII